MTTIPVQQIIERRVQVSKESLSLLKKRKRWVAKLMTFCYDMPRYREMYKINGEIYKTPEEHYGYFNQRWNIRTMLHSETIAEIDKLPWKKMLLVMSEIIQSLIRKKIHFAIFYAEGQRSPHIRIYDFEDLEELKPHERESAQAEFWKDVTPWFFHYLDHGVWSEDHRLPLEFALHWKYGTPYNLIYEHLPQNGSHNLTDEEIYDQTITYYSVYPSHPLMLFTNYQEVVRGCKP